MDAASWPPGKQTGYLISPIDQDLSPPPSSNTAGYRFIRSPTSRTLALRITKNAARSWVTRRNGKSITVGSLEHWSHEQALERDAELNRMIDQGRDPNTERETQKATPTVVDLIAMWRADVSSTVPPRLRPGTMLEYEGMLSQWSTPQLGAKRVVDVSRDDLRELHQRITYQGRKIVRDGKFPGTPGRADRVLALASSLLAFAMAEGLRR